MAERVRFPAYCFFSGCISGMHKIFISMWFSFGTFCIQMPHLARGWYLSIQQFMQDFSVDFSVHKMFGGRKFFRGWNEIFSIGNSPEFGVIFHKYALELIKNWKIIEKIREKNSKISENFLILGKTKNIILTCYNGGSGGGAPSPPEGRKIFRNFVEIGYVKFKNLITFQKLHEFFDQSWTKI